MPGGAVGLVAGEGVEVAVEILHVDRHVHGGLAAVDQHRDAARMGDAARLLDRHDGAQHIRHVRDGDHLGARGEQLLELVEQELAAVGDRRPLEHAPLRSRWKCQGTMLEWCSMMESTISSPLPESMPPNELATRLMASVALRVKMISSTLGALRKRRTVSRASSKLGGGGVGEIVQPAMHVGVFHLVGVLDGLQHGARLLRRGAVVEIDQRLAVDLAEQDRKIGADALDVVGAPPARSAPLIIAVIFVLRRRAHGALPADGRPAGACMASAPRAALVLDLVERLADEALDQQRARLPGGMPRERR